MPPTVLFPASHAPWRVSPSSTVRPSPFPFFPTSHTDKRVTEDGELYEMLKSFGIAHSTFTAHQMFCEFVGVNFAFALQVMKTYSFLPTPSVTETRELRERLRASAIRYAVPPNRDSPRNIQSVPSFLTPVLRLTTAHPHVDALTRKHGLLTGTRCLSCCRCVMCGAWWCRHFQRICSSCLTLCIVSFSGSADCGWAGANGG